MMSLNRDYFNSFCSHIYIEQSVKSNPRTQRILEQFPNAQQIEISHYKDVFCRRGQNYRLQHRGQSLILAEKKGNLVYTGAAACQSFGNAHFYYTSCMMNCVFDCEYCYLKGMYPSANIVIFVNLEDFFAEVEEKLKSHPVYLCVSYDTDLLAFERVLGYGKEWAAFADGHSGLEIEIRTKSAGDIVWDSFFACEGVVLAFTLSPQEVIDAYEHGTPPLRQRLSCVAKAQEAGISTRLCFDPVIYCPDYKLRYGELLDQVFSIVDMERIKDVSVGSFRAPKDYLKKMRKQYPDSAVVQFPYENARGICQYPKELAEEMEEFLVCRLKERMRKEQIFVWNQGD